MIFKKREISQTMTEVVAVKDEKELIIGSVFLNDKGFNDETGNQYHTVDEAFESIVTNFQIITSK